ncbi:MAG: ribosome-associated translation inhibitor RaiA [Candidatus Pacebacteria bacterium]|nr:ribosome-associated translation inhibitor RaiA [Candidatus Paceibacterota bacterium]MBP9772891.1 ribosome-associated translation inhibitor RaiA [Candidatus Paceibacterota bacterium]QQR76384.1 MAG: ribosome-associated translation inhibitor RaiA [Candidatus Nomurabacteria bacterium]
MLNINIKTTNMELTSAIREYTEKKIETLEKVMKSSPEVINIEIGKTTNHHKQGDVYKAELNMAIGGYKFHTESEEEDLYAAIDAVREDMFRQLTENKDRNETLFRRGARSVKKMLKGLSDRNPFTSKY